MVDIIKEKLNFKYAIYSITEGLDIIPSRIDNAILDNLIMLEKHPLDRIYKDQIDEIKDNYDLIIIDCPPALGQSVAAATLSADIIIAPVTPEEFSLSGLQISNTEITNIEKTYKKNIELKIVLNKFDTRTSLSHEVLSNLIKHPIFSKKLFKTYIRISQDFPNSITNKQSIFDSTKSSTAKEDIDLLTKEILDINKKDIENISLGYLKSA
jgi:chromosome partitioning protein